MYTWLVDFKLRNFSGKVSHLADGDAVRQYYLGDCVAITMVARPEARKWCFTINNPVVTEEQLRALLVDLGAEYAVFQLEAGEAGTPHFQGYMYLSSKMRLTAIKRILPTAHLEVARGTHEQNRTYCTKPEGRIGEFSEIGIFPEVEERARTDLTALHSALKAGLTQKSFAEDYFDVFLRCPNLVTNFCVSQIQERDPRVPHECLLIYGPPGTGKSRLSEFFGGNGFRCDNGKWFDGYGGQHTLIFDDFGGASIPFRAFKRIVDRYPLRVEIKGTSCQLATTKTIITSNYLPEEWWSQEVVGTHISAIIRRITYVIWAPEPNVFYQFWDYASFARAIAPVYVAPHALPLQVPDVPFEVLPPPWQD